MSSFAKRATCIYSDHCVQAKMKKMEFNTIWEEFKNPVENFIKIEINDVGAVDDILQEVSIKLLDNINRKTKINNYQTWIFQVTRNTISDYYRQKKKQSRYLPASTDMTSATNNCVCDLSDFVIKNYLPEKYGTPLYLSDIEKIPQKEISKILNLTLTATKSRIQRGRKKLKELILECVDLSYNSRGQITGYKLKDNCNLPPELVIEIEKLKLML